MALNDRATPPPEARVGRPKKKRKRSKHEDEPFVKDGKLSRKGRTITCQSCGNIGHNKATCKGQGRKAKTGGNNTEGSGSASRQAQQTEPAIGQDGSGGSGVGAVISLSAAVGEGSAGDPGGAGVASQGSSHTRWTKRIVQTERICPQKRTHTQPASQPSTSSQVPVIQTRNAMEEKWVMVYQHKSDNGKFPMVGEEDLTFKKLAPMAEESIMLSEGLGGGYLRDYVRVVVRMDDGEEVPLNNNIGKDNGDFVDMSSEAVEQGMDDHVPDEMDGAKCEQLPNLVVKKGNLEFLVCKQVLEFLVCIRLQTMVEMELVTKKGPTKEEMGLFVNRMLMHFMNYVCQ
ncbi:hypothetical protein Tco_1160104 [Tanacetum coccineum]